MANVLPPQSPYAGLGTAPWPDDRAGPAGAKTPLDRAQHAGAPEALGAERAANFSKLAPRVQDEPTPLLFQGQLPLAPPPDGTTSSSTANGLTQKCQVLLRDPADSPPAVPPDPPPAPPPTPHLTFSIQAVMALLIDAASKDFKEAQQETQMNLQQKLSEMDASANQIIAAAAKRLKGALVAGAGQIVLGGLSAIGGAVSLGGAARANFSLSKQQPALDLGTQAQVFQQKTAVTSAAYNVMQGVGQAQQGGMSIWQGQEDRDAAGSDKDKAEDDKAVAGLEALHESASSMKQQYLALMQDLVQKAQALEQSHDAALTTVARNV
jgi:hypothetical protein